MSGLDATFGVKVESTYGTAVTVDRFFEQTKNTLAGVYGRIESQAVRAGTRFLRADRWAPNPKGASGTASMEILSQTFGLWAKLCLGHIDVVAGTDALAGSSVMTATPASLTGLSFTAQIGKPDSTDSVHPFTYAGCKVSGWTLHADVDGILSLDADIDAASENITTSGVNALHAADYSDNAGAELLTYVGGHVAIAGSDVLVSTVSFKGDNALNLTRWKQGAHKEEPAQDGMSVITGELDMEFDSMAQVSRIAAATAAGATAEIVTFWQSPTEIGTTGLFPTLKITIAAARFDGELPTVDGAKMIAEKVTITATDNGTDPVIKWEYTTSDSVA